MKFSYTIFTCVLLLFASSLFGQKIKDKRAKFTYVSLPTEKLPADFNTYSVNVYGRALVVGGNNSDAAGKSITMDGFKKVAHHGRDGGGHLRLVVNTGSVVEGRASIKSRKSTSTDKKTKKVTTTYYYWYEVPYSAAPTFTIYDPEGNVLASGGKSYSDTEKTKESTRRPNSSSLTSVRKSVNRSVANGIINQAKLTLATKFDYKKRLETKEMYLIRKTDNEKDYEKYYEQVKAEWSKMDGATPAEELKAKFADALAFYSAEAAKDPGENKKLKRVFLASNYNLALMSYYIGDLEKAVEHANKVLAIDKKHKKSKRLIENAQKIKKGMEFHGINSMHYARDLSNAKAPAVSKALEEQAEAVSETTNVLEGVVMAEGKEVSGTFMSSKNAAELDFSEKGNTKFITEEDGKEMEYDLTAPEITAFSLGDRKFVKMSFTPSAKGKGEAAMNIMEEVYTSEKINLYKYYPSGGALSDAKPEFAFKKATDDAPVSLYATQFLILKKGLAKYFADCTDLKEMCTEGTIEMEQESLIKAARIYAEVCE